MNPGSVARDRLFGSFVHVGKPARVLFGNAMLGRLGEEIAALGVRRALVLTTPGQRDAGERTSALLGERSAGVFSGATMHTPTQVTEVALRMLVETDADGVVAIGGGSTIGLGKALALRTDVVQIAIPTTYAGSEMTDILGEAQDGEKRTLRSPKVLPETVIYDVDLTMSLPAPLSVTSGVNAIAHAVEAIYAPDTNPLLALMAEEGIRALACGLPRIVERAGDHAGRYDALYGAWLCGACLNGATMGLHHKLCHTLGGMFNLPHAQTHTVLLPYTMAYNSGAAQPAMARIARALAVNDATLGLHAMLRRFGAPDSLQVLGMPEGGIDAATDAAMRNPYANPRPLERSAIRELIARAWSGAAPAP